MSSKSVIARTSTIMTLEEHILNHYGYGDLIPYEVLERITGAVRGSFDFVVIMGKLKDDLLHYGYVLVYEINAGYRILLPSQVTDYVVNKHLLKSIGVLEKGIKILHYTDREDLTKTEKERIDSVEKFIRELKKDNENKILKDTFILSNARIKELKEGE